MKKTVKKKTTRKNSVKKKVVKKKPVRKKTVKRKVVKKKTVKKKTVKKKTVKKPAKKKSWLSGFFSKKPKTLKTKTTSKKPVTKKSKKKLTINIKKAIPKYNAKLSFTDTLETAIKLLSKYRVTGIPVFKNKKIVGIITITDITNFVDKKGVNKIVEHDKNHPVSKLMSKNPISIDETKNLVDALDIMIHKKVSKLIVLSKTKKYLGIVSRADILNLLTKILTKPERTPSSEIHTDIDAFYFSVIEKKSGSAKYFADLLSVDVDAIEDWAKSLSEHDLVEITYSAFGGMTIKVKKRLKK